MLLILIGIHRYAHQRTKPEAWSNFSKSQPPKLPLPRNFPSVPTCKSISSHITRPMNKLQQHPKLLRHFLLQTNWFVNVPAIHQQKWLQQRAFTLVNFSALVPSTATFDVYEAQIELESCREIFMDSQSFLNLWRGSLGATSDILFSRTGALFATLLFACKKCPRHAIRQLWRLAKGKIERRKREGQRRWRRNIFTLKPMKSVTRITEIGLLFTWTRIRISAGW